VTLEAAVRNDRADVKIEVDDLGQTLDVGCPRSTGNAGDHGRHGERAEQTDWHADLT
jgi:hypothetical protein